MMYLALLIPLLATAGVKGYSNGAPISACGEMTPSNLASPNGHGASPTTTTFPYEIKFSRTCFKAGDTVDVTVSIKSGQSTNFEGVFLQARKASSPNTFEYLGTWNILSSNLKTINCGSGSSNAVTHKDKNTKTSETVQWTAPASSVLSESVVFRVTVVQTKMIFWVKQDSSTLTYSSTCVSGATSMAVSTVMVAIVAFIRSVL